MKNKKISILILLLSLISTNVYAQDLCSKNGYTIVTINGVFTDETGAKDNKENIKKLLPPTYKNEPLTVGYLYNQTHWAGIKDAVDSIRQGLFDSKTDYDFVEMLNEASSKVNTQKLLLVGHSQGNFYANDIYDAIVNKDGGVPAESMGVYGVATPDDYVAGGGKYLTSDTDKIIAAFAGRFKTIMSPNSHIDLHDGDDSNGHNFSDVYLKYKSGEIVKDIKYSLDKLKTNTIQKTDSLCINPPKITVLHKINGIALNASDFLVNGVVKITSIAYNTISSTTKYIASGAINLTKSGLALVGFVDNNSSDQPVTDTNIVTKTPDTFLSTDQVQEDSSILTKQDTTDQNSIGENGDAKLENNSIVKDEAKDAADVFKATGGSADSLTDNTGGTSLGGGNDKIDSQDPVETPEETPKPEINPEPPVEVDNTVYTNSDINNNSINDADEDTVLISTNTTLDVGAYKFNNLEILSGATLTLKGDPNSSSEYKGVKIKAQNIKIDKGGFITADLEGYGALKGPGASLDAQIGASYGGKSLGGLDSSIYGSAIKPLDLGSGGVSNGGGAIYLDVKGDLTNDGAISANGGGSSSGGSIYVKTKSLLGGGLFSANGGGMSVGGYFTSPGGGGRVAIYYVESSFDGICEAKAGSGSYDGWSVSYSSPGTVGFFDIKNNNLIVTSFWKFEENDSPFNFNEVRFINNSVIETGKNINLKANNLIIDDGSRFTLVSDNQKLEIPKIVVDKNSVFTLSKYADLILGDISLENNSSITTKQGEEINLTLNNLNIDQNSFISLNEKGLAVGPGTPTSGYAGASYGGYGSMGKDYSAIYGNEDEPVDMGSGGFGYHPFGGGAIKIKALSINNNGFIYANGNNTSTGGSVYIIADTIEGAGFISANGGTSYCPNVCFGPGGGGRIAIHYKTSSFNRNNVTANGWSGFGGASNAGTIKWIDMNIVVPEPVTLSSLKVISSFNFESLTPKVIGDIDEADHTISLTVPYGTDISTLSPTIIVSDKSTITPASLSVNDFTNPVTYIVKAEDDSDASYVVSVVVSPNPDPEPKVEETGDPNIKSYSLNGDVGNITINPLVNNLTIILNANKKVNWMSIKIEKESDNKIYKIFQAGSSCVNGTNICTKVWNGILSSGGLLQSGNYKIRVHIKDIDGREYEQYLSSLVIVNI